MARTTRKIVIRYPVVTTRVTKSGRLWCNYCRTWNQARAGLVNPICGICKRPLA